MIEGVVNSDYQAVIDLTIQGPAGQTREIEAIVDTGYNGFMTLPPALVDELALSFSSINRATLGDGSEVSFPSYGVALLWDNRQIHIEADATGGIPLVGMLLLDGYNLNMDIEQGGTVIISAKE